MNTELTHEELQEEFENLLKRIRQFALNGNYIYRGESDEENSDLASNLYRQLSQKHDNLVNLRNFSIGQVQSRMLESAKEHTTEKDDDVILEQIQHYGGHTNQIDFSADYLVALFFACEGNSSKNGKLIFLDKDKLKDEDKLHIPKSPLNRVIMQKSVFVRPVSGKLDLDGEVIVIKSELKQYVLAYLNKHHGINYASIYNDIHGFIERSKNYQDAYTHYYLGFAYQEEGNSGKALEHYTKSIEIDGNHPIVYNNRGYIFMNASRYNVAIADFNKAIGISEEYVYPYYNRGWCKEKSSDYKGALEDYKTALYLAKQQGIQEVVDQAPKKIDEISKKLESSSSPTDFESD